MSDHHPPPAAPTVEERLARLEARVAELERRQVSPDGPLLGSGRPLTDAQVDAVWKLLGGDQTTVGPTPLQRLILAENLSDPTIPWGRMEVERMREE